MVTYRRAAAMVVVLATAVTGAACGGGGEETAAAGQRSTQARVQEIASIPVGPEPGELAVGFGSVWAVHSGSHVARIDPATNTVKGTIQAANAGFLGVGEGAVWILDDDGDKVRRIDPSTNRVVATIAVGAAPSEVAFTPGAVWIGNHHGGSVSRIDPRTNAVVATVRVGPSGRSGPGGVAAAAGAVWVGVHNLNSVVRIDPTTNEVVAKIPMPEGVESCGGVGGDGRDVWISEGGCGGRVARIDPATNKVVDVLYEGSPLDYGVEVGDPRAARGSLWLTKSTPTSAFLYEIDPATAKPLSKRALRRGAVDIAFGFGSLWLSDRDRGRVMRLEPK